MHNNCLFTTFGSITIDSKYIIHFDFSCVQGIYISMLKSKRQTNQFKLTKTANNDAIKN